MVDDLLSLSFISLLCAPHTPTLVSSPLSAEQQGMACLAILHIVTLLLKMKSPDVGDPSAVCVTF